MVDRISRLNQRPGVLTGGVETTVKGYRNAKIWYRSDRACTAISYRLVTKKNRGEGNFASEDSLQLFLLTVWATRNDHLLILKTTLPSPAITCALSDTTTQSVLQQP
jgi:hypothetical protein